MLQLNRVKTPVLHDNNFRNNMELVLFHSLGGYIGTMAGKFQKNIL
jgi:hypothetical protein